MDTEVKDEESDEVFDLLKDMTPEELKKLHADCEYKFTEAKKRRIPYEQQWYLNLAFYMGHQYVVPIASKAKLSGNSTGLWEPPAPRWGVRLIANKIQPTVRNELTKLTKEEIQFYVVPNTTDSSDVTAARAGESIAEYMFIDIELNRIRSAASLWATLTGVGIIKSMYEPNVPDSAGIMGKVGADSINPFHFWAGDLSLDTMEKQPYVFHAQTMDKEEVEAMFGVECESDSTADDSTIGQKIKNLLDMGSPTQNKVYVREMWVKPNYKYPEGAVIWFTAGKILKALPWFYTHMQYPFMKIDHIPVPGRFYADSVVTQMVSLQREYNKVRSQLLENKNRMSRPQLLAPKGSVDPRKITSEPGLIIEYTPGFNPPTPLPIPQVPSYVLQEQDRILKDMDDVSGQYEITKGRTPPGVEAASAIAYLQEENDSRMHHTITSVENAMSRLGRQLLSLVGQYWDEPRIVKVISTNSAYEAKKFKGSDLRGNTDFRIEPGSMAPRSKAAKQAFITELMKMGAIPPNQGLKYMQMSETNRLYQELQLDQRQQERETDKMAEMTAPIMDPTNPNPDPMAAMIQPLPINEWDNHQIHRDTCANFMKTQEFELLPEENKQAIIQHFQAHDAELKRLAAEMQMQQMNVPGGAIPNG